MIIVKRFNRTTRLINFTVIVVVFMLLSACSTSEKIEHIEAFVIETSEENLNEEGMYESTGYMKVNAITIIVEGKGYLKTEEKVIEDSYDLEGKFIKSEIKHVNASKSSITMHNNADSRKKELQVPSTILIPDMAGIDHATIYLSEEEKKQVKEHVLAKIKEW